jgi:hypothetical protein
VVAGAVDVNRQVDEGVGSVAQLPRPRPVGDQGDQTEGRPGDERRRYRAREDAELRLVERLATEGQARDQQ